MSSILYCQLLPKLILNRMEFKSMRKVSKTLFYFLMWHCLVVAFYVKLKKKNRCMSAWCQRAGYLCGLKERFSYIYSSGYELPKEQCVEYIRM